MVAFHVIVVIALLRTAEAAIAITKDTPMPESKVAVVAKAAKWTRLTALMTAGAITTSVIYVSAIMVELSAVITNHTAAAFAIGVPNLLDLVSNTLASGMLAGFWGPTAARRTSLALRFTAQAAVERREQLVREKLLAAVNVRTGRASTIAALVGTNEPTALVAEAVRRFRCISWAVFREHSELILEDSPLDGAVAASHLYGLSQPCQLTQSDVFFSHSWHDAQEQKWATLTQWCQTFEQRHSQ